VRDLETDRRAGKRTLAVRMGRARTRVFYAVVLVVAYLALVPLALGLTAWVLLAVLSVPLALRLVQVVRTRTDGPALNGALAGTGQLQLVFCVLLSVGILLS
jgi:1,4-dihydroxy-2-naphthoate octaprenyltransferase